MKINLTDRKSDFVNPTNREYTPEGFLKVTGRVARSGIQYYYGCELGDERHKYKKFAVYRPADVVLSDEVCEKFNGVDLTNDHPKNFIDSKTYKDKTAGVVIGNAYKDKRDEHFICCDMLIKDEKTIRAVRAGKVQLSVGYSNGLVKESGVTPDGEAYDYKVSNISQINHVALVNRARAGAKARLFDGAMMKTVKLNDVEVDLRDAVAEAVQAEFDKLKKQFKDTEKELAEVTAENASLKDSLEQAQEIRLTDEDVKQIVKTYNEVMDSAKKIVGDNFTCDSYDPLAVKIKALQDKGIDTEGKSEDFIEGCFSTMLLNAENKMNDSQKQFADSVSVGKEQKSVDYMEAYKERMSKAWMTDNNS